jgi:polyisoprenoid-binding protein YceI
MPSVLAIILPENLPLDNRDFLKYTNLQIVSIFQKGINLLQVTQGMIGKRAFDMAWQLDRAHTHIQFSARHLMVTNVRGQFEDFDIKVNFDEDNLVNSNVEVSIKAESINTRVADRDNHLRSADFLDAANYPVITFKSKHIALNGANAGRIAGDLTIRGVTREVVLDVEYTGLLKNPWGQFAAGFNASTVINRKDWGLVWNVALETGGVLVGDEIKIEVEAELVKVPESAPEAAQTA